MAQKSVNFANRMRQRRGEAPRVRDARTANEEVLDDMESVFVRGFKRHRSIKETQDQVRIVNTLECTCPTSIYPSRNGGTVYRWDLDATSYAAIIVDELGSAETHVYSHGMETDVLVNVDLAGLLKAILGMKYERPFQR